MIGKRFEEFISQYNLIKMNDKILVAISGGADSVMLLHLLLSIKQSYNLTLEAFHLNHNLRDEAGVDETFVTSLCEKQEIICHTAHSDIKMISQKLSLSVEEAGRIERYRFFDEILSTRKLSRIATAHHMDDNAETMIMRLIRGTGLHGLEGIPLKRDDKIIRPLMFLTKEEIIHYLEQNNIQFITDQSNFDTAYFRNRIRMDILPMLKKENPKIVQSLMHLSDIARMNNDLIESISQNIDIKIRNNTAVVQYEYIFDVHDIIKNNILKKMAEKISITKDINYNHIQNLIKLINDKENTTWDSHLPGILVKRRYDELIVSELKEKTIDQNFSYPIGFKGIFIFPKEKFIIKTSKEKKIEKIGYNQYIKTVDYDKINHILNVKNRVEGDFFYPLGLGGKKSLKKYFIDKKIPKEERANILILKEADNVVCILGKEIDDRYKITQQTQNFLLVEYLTMEDSNV